MGVLDARRFCSVCIVTFLRAVTETAVRKPESSHSTFESRTRLGAASWHRRRWLEAHPSPPECQRKRCEWSCSGIHVECIRKWDRRLFNFLLVVKSSDPSSGNLLAGAAATIFPPVIMPPLQDITRRFVQSPLPPSSSPALSYIDDDKENPVFLALKTPPARPAAAEHKPTDESENNEFDRRPPSAFASNPIFSTPTSKPATRPAPLSPGDPFGFLAAERKLKLDRSRDGSATRNRTRSRPLKPLNPDRRKRPKLDPSATPSTHALTPLAPTTTDSAPAKPAPTLGRVSTHPQTPISRPTADIRTLTPPPATPFHIKRRRRRRTTAVLAALDDEGDNPFLADSRDVLSTPSPVKRPSARPRRVAAPKDDEGDKVVNDENVNPFCTPTVLKGASSMPPSVLSSAAPPVRRKRKRARAEEVEGLDEGDETFSALADDPDALARALRARLPKRKTREESVGVVTPVKKSSRTKVKRGKSDKDVEVGNGEDGEDVKEVKGVRRSTRLSKRGPLADSNKEKKAKVGKTTTRATKGKGKENADRAFEKASAAMKGKGKAKDKLRVDGELDDETVSLLSISVQRILTRISVGEGPSCEGCVFQKT